MDNKMKTSQMITLFTLGVSALASCGGGGDTKVVHFNVDGGTAIGDMTVPWGKNLTREDIPETTKEGHTLVNWYTDAKKTVVFTEKTVEEDITLYAKWSVNSYTVSYFDGEDGTTKLFKDKKFNYAAAVELPIPTKKNVTFAAWYTDASLSESSRVTGTYKMPSHDVSLYAEWSNNSYDVTFDPNGDDVSGQMAAVHLAYRGKVTLPYNAFVRTGYEFAGWNTAPDGSGKAYADGDDVTEFEKAAGTLTLYAQWRAKAYKVKFFNNSTEIPDLELAQDYRTALSIPDDPAYVAERDGFTFQGWGRLTKVTDTEFDKSKNYFSISGTVVSALGYAQAKAAFEAELTIYEVTAFPEGYLISGDTNVYAKFARKENTIAFLSDSGVVAAIKGYFGEPVSLPTPQYAGHTFLGWYQEGSTERFDPADMKVTVPASSIVLNAKWAVNSYSVSYETNTDESILTETLAYDTPLAEYLPDDLKKDGHTFQGWYYDAGFTQEASELDKVPDHDVVLHACWKANEVNVEYHANFGEDEQGESTHVYGEEGYVSLASLSSLGFANKGYTFAGWNTQADGKGKVVTALGNDDFGEDGKTIVLYAQWTVNGYAVSYDTGAESISVNDVSLDYGTPLGDYLPNLNRGGYAFGGWFYDKECKTPVNSTDTVPDHDIKLYAKWIAKSLTVNYDLNGGEGEIDPTSHTYGEEGWNALDPTVPSYLGYTFAGWNTQADGKGKAYTALTVSDFAELSGEITLYAKWAQNVLSVSYHGNTANSGEMAESHHVYDEGDWGVLSENLFAKTGNHFVGWNTREDGKGTSYESLSASDFKETSSSLSLYAQWAPNEITVNYHANEGEGEIASTHHTYGSGEYTALTSERFSRVGYTFAGWNTKADGTGTAYANLSTADFDKDGKTIDLYARWTINGHEVAYVPGNGETIHAIDLNYGTVLDDYLPEVSRLGYDFGGWFYDAGFEKAVKEGDAVPDADITLYAKWVAHTVKVVYDANGGTDAPASTDHVFGAEDCEKITADEPKLEGHTFLGWYRNPESTGDDVTELATSDFGMVGGEVTLYAKWAINTYKISYVTNGGSSVANQNVVYGKDVVVPETTRAGYTFAGWFYDAELKNAVKEGDKMPAENITLYAKWNANAITLHYDANGGIGAPSDSPRAFDGENYDKISTDEPTREGYTFLGWYRSTEPNAAKVEKLATADFGENGATVTVYAHWGINAYQVSYVTGTDEIIDAKNVDYGTVLADYLPELERIGYDFGGWYVGEVKYDAESTMPAGDIVLVAKWTAHTLKVNYVSNYEAGPEDVIANLAYGQDGYTSVAPSNTFVREGHTFLGWEDKDGNPVTGFNDLSYAESANEITLKAKWSVNAYQVVYVTNGGSSVNVANVDYGTEVPQPSSSRAGYTFAGWFYDAELKNAVKAGDKMPASGLILYADWTANTVKVTYDANGGINAPAQTDHVFANGADYAEISADIPSREGYTFLGWYRSTEPNAAKVNYLATGDFKEVGGTLTIYAKWAVNAYKVSYVTGNGQVIADANVDYGTALGEYLPQINRTGYDFGGWWIGEVRYDADATMPAENLTLTARWTAHTLRVIYSANYQDGPSSLVMNYTYGVGTYQSVAADDTFSRAGYTFAGWYRVKEPTDETTRVSGYGDSDYASSSSTITLYAKWNINTYKVSYATNGGSSINVADVTYDAEIPLSATSRTGYTFAGWYYDSEFENAVTAGDKMPAANVTLYAKWTVNVVTVTYDANEGAGSMPASEGHTYGGENYLNLSANAYTREGYTFAGWNTAADGSGEFIVKSGDVYVLPAAYFNVDGGKAVTLYAYWTINAYKVTYVTGNGDSIDPVDLNYGTSFAGKVPSLTRTGYTFAGWFDGETQYTAESTMPASNVTLTAKWVEAEVKLTVSISLENPANLGSYGAATGYDYVTFKTSETVDIDAIVAALIAEHTQYAHYENVNAANPHSITLDPTGNAVAIKLDLVRHAATFKDGETVKGAFSVAYGTNVLADATFAAAIYRKGYTPKFTVGETVYYDYTQIVIAGDTEIAIGYDVNTNALTANANGGTFASTSKTTAAFESFAYGTVFLDAVENPVRDGYDFVGWFWDSALTQEAIAMDDGEHDTIYAGWLARTLKVTYVANYDEGPEDFIANLTYDAAGYNAVAASGTFARTGYTFVRWEDGDGNPVSAFNKDNYLGTANAITLYAKWNANTTTVTYNANGGTAAPTATVHVYDTENYAKIATGTPTRVGYTFASWNTKADGTGATVAALSDADFSVDGKAITLYALWTVNSYALVYDANGGTGSSLSPRVVNYGTSFEGLLPSVTRYGYDFLGWYSGETKVSATTTMPAESVTLVARWLAHTLTVSYDGNGSTSGSTAGSTKTYGVSGWNQVAENGFAKTGYHFVGWNTKADGSGETVTAFEASDYFTYAEREVTLYAKWVANVTTVTYYANGGENAPEARVHTYDAVNYDKISTNEPDRTGYTFVGWNTEADGTGATVTALNDADFAEDGNAINLYAQWQVNSYTITYYTDGTPVANRSVAYNEHIVLPETSMTGYTFVGWKYAPMHYASVDDLMPANDIELYAEFQINVHTIAIEPGNGSTIDPVENVEYNSGVRPYLPEAVVRAGYDFDGWYIGDVKVDGNTKLPDSDIVVTAHWIARDITVSYNGNGSTGGATANTEATFDQEGWNAVAANGFTKTGYHFDGWYRNAECTGDKVEALVASDFNKAESTLTLYAKWVQNVTTVKYDANGGTNAPADTVHVYGQDGYAAISAGQPTKTGYTFAGWNTKADGSGDAVTALNDADFSEDGKVVTLYAQWNVNVVKVAYNGNGGSGLMPTLENHNYGIEDYLNLTENTFTRTGYAFVGWNTKADRSGESFAKVGGVYVLPEAYFLVDGGKTVTLYAQWDVVAYQLSFNADGGVSGEDLSPRPIDYGTGLYDLLPTVTRDCYVFDGWYLNDVKVTGSTTMPAGDATLVAHWNPYVLTITYDGNGGTGSIEPQVKYYGSTGWSQVAPSDTFAKDGYHFLYWNSRADGQGTYYNDLVGAYLEPEGTLTLYAIWQYNRLNVTYRDTLLPGNPVIAEATKKYEDGTEWNKLYTPSKTGYFFAGWYRNPQFSGYKVTEFAVEDFADSVNDLTLYAKWIAKTITVVYDGNGANSGSVEAEVHVYGAEGYATIAENGFVKNGHHFVQWVDQYNVVVTALTDEIYSFGGSDKTMFLRAVWEVNAIAVNYNDAYGSGAPAPTGHTYGEENYTQISATEPTRDGYTFKGWYRDAECTGDKVTALAVSDFAENGATVNLYAKWEVNQFDITYHTNGGNSINVETVDYGTVLVKPTPTKTGYAFVGWFYDSGFTQAVGTTDTMPSHDVDLYAKWEINAYQLSYVPGNGDTIDPVNVVYNTAFTSLLPEVARTGYVFDGWYLNDVKATAATTMPAGNATLVAHWTAKVLHVSYLANGADAGLMPQGDDAEEHVYDAAGFDELADCTYTKVGHHFAGWYVGDTLVVSLADYFAFAGETGNVSVQAKWVKNTVTVIFESNEGTGTMDEEAHVYQDPDYLVLSENEFAKAGHTFAGWNTKADGTGIAITKNGVGDYVLPGDFFNENADKYVTLYAQWTVNTITLVYNGNGATSGSMGWEDRTYGEPGYSDVASTSFSRTGYQFQGWCFNAGGFGDIVTELSDENFAQDGFTLVLYAKWQVVKSTITYHTGLEEEAEPVVVQPVQLDYGTGLSDSLPTLLGVAAPFMGWYYDSEYTQPASTSDRMPDHNIDLYAKWGAVKPLVYFVNGNAVYNAGDYDENSDFFDYVQDIYNQTEAYDYVYNSVLSPAVGGVTIPLGVAIVCYGYFAQTQGAYGIAPLSFVLSNLLQQASVAQAQAESLAAAFIAAGRNRDKFITINVLGNNGVSAENALQFYAAWEKTSGDHDSFVEELTPSIGAENAEAAYQGMYGAHAVLNAYDVTNSQEAFIAALSSVVDAATAGKLYALFGAYDNMIPMGKAYDGLATKVFPYIPLNAAYQEYWQTIAAATNSDALNSALSLTSEKREIRFDEYLAYEANGFDPIAQADGYYFDHWEQTVTDDYVERTAVFAYQLPTVVGISHTHTSDSVTFTWDSVKSSGSTVDTNVWGYRVAVTIYRENSSGQYIAIESYEIDRPGVENCEYHVGNLKTHDKVEISIVALWGDKREAIEPKTVTSLIPGKGQVTTASHKLSSEAAQVTYINNEIAEINFDNLHTGDFYSVDPDNLILYLFTDNSYSFAQGGDLLITEDEDHIASIEGGQLITSSKSGSFKLTIGSGIKAKTYSAIVYPLLQSLSLGASWTSYLVANVSSSEAEIKTDPSKYYGENKAPITVGAAKVVEPEDDPIASVYEYCDYNTSITTGEGILATTTKYYNGVKLDIVATSNSGTTIDNKQFKYDVTVTQGTATWIAGTDYVYDDATGAIYFLKAFDETGYYDVTITAMPSVTNNIYVPHKYLETASTYAKSFNVRVIDGYNVYSHESLYHAYADPSIATINLLADINVEFSARMVSPVDYIVAYKSSLPYTSLLGSGTTESPYHGEVDIQDNTAYMAAVYSGYKGPKYVHYEGTKTQFYAEFGNDAYCFEAFLPNGSSAVFYYDAAGAFYIDHGAKWIQNVDGGHFKIINGNPTGAQIQTMANYGLEYAFCYDRHNGNAEMTNALTVNGNYFIVDASNLPYVYTAGKVAVTSFTARYNIQNVQACVFANHGYDLEATAESNTALVTFSNLTLYGNTGNTSKYYTGSEDKLKENMEQQSGGINGFASHAWKGDGQGDPKTQDLDEVKYGGYHYGQATSAITLQGVNIYNTLIAAFDDTNMSLDYVHIDNNWANSVYGNGGVSDLTFNISHSYIGTSGGAAIHIEDNSIKYDPTVNIDYTTTTIENMITGEEPWFKGYGMEVLALGLKGQFESAIQAITAGMVEAQALPCTYTILQEVTSGAVTSEQMNFAFFSKNDQIASASTLDHHVIRNLTNAPASDFFCYTPDTSMTGGIEMTLMFNLKGGKSYLYYKMQMSTLFFIGLLEIFPNA